MRVVLVVLSALASISLQLKSAIGAEDSDFIGRELPADAPAEYREDYLMAPSLSPNKKLALIYPKEGDEFAMSVGASVALRRCCQQNHPLSGQEGQRMYSRMQLIFGYKASIQTAGIHFRSCNIRKRMQEFPRSASDGKWYPLITMEWVEGRSLQELLGGGRFQKVVSFERYVDRSSGEGPTTSPLATSSAPWTVYR